MPIFRVQRLVAFVLALGFLHPATRATATEIASRQGGPWSAAATWTGGVAPGSNDTGVVQAGHAVTVSTPLELRGPARVQPGGCLWSAGPDAGLLAGIPVRLNGGLFVFENASASTVQDGNFTVSANSAFDHYRASGSESRRTVFGALAFDTAGATLAVTNRDPLDVRMVTVFTSLVIRADAALAVSDSGADRAGSVVECARLDLPAGRTLTKAGPNALRLTGDNTGAALGALLVREGTLEVATRGALGAASVTTRDRGTLLVNAGDGASGLTLRAVDGGTIAGDEDLSAADFLFRGATLELRNAVFSYHNGAASRTEGGTFRAADTVTLDHFSRDGDTTRTTTFGALLTTTSNAVLLVTNSVAGNQVMYSVFTSATVMARADIVVADADPARQGSALSLGSLSLPPGGVLTKRGPNLLTLGGDNAGAARGTVLVAEGEVRLASARALGAARAVVTTGTTLSGNADTPGDNTPLMLQGASVELAGGALVWDNGAASLRQDGDFLVTQDSTFVHRNGPGSLSRTTTFGRLDFEAGGPALTVRDDDNGDDLQVAAFTGITVRASARLVLAAAGVRCAALCLPSNAVLALEGAGEFSLAADNTARAHGTLAVEGATVRLDAVGGLGRTRTALKPGGALLGSADAPGDNTPDVLQGAAIELRGGSMVWDNGSASLEQGGDVLVTAPSVLHHFNGPGSLSRTTVFGALAFGSDNGRLSVVNDEPADAVQTACFTGSRLDRNGLLNVGAHSRIELRGLRVAAGTTLSKSGQGVLNVTGTVGLDLPGGLRVLAGGPLRLVDATAASNTLTKTGIAYDTAEGTWRFASTPDALEAAPSTNYVGVLAGGTNAVRFAAAAAGCVLLASEQGGTVRSWRLSLASPAAEPVASSLRRDPLLRGAQAVAADRVVFRACVPRSAAPCIVWDNTHGGLGADVTAIEEVTPGMVLAVQ